MHRPRTEGSSGPDGGGKSVALGLGRRHNERIMTHDEAKQIVLDIIADIAPDEDVSAVVDDVRLREQLDLDSMDFLDIVMELRKRHGIEVPEEDYGQLATLKSSADYLTPKFNAVQA